jgi:hypothetical protein
MRCKNNQTRPIIDLAPNFNNKTRNAKTVSTPIGTARSHSSQRHEAKRKRALNSETRFSVRTEWIPGACGRSIVFLCKSAGNTTPHQSHKPLNTKTNSIPAQADTVRNDSLSAPQAKRSELRTLRCHTHLNEKVLEAQSHNTAPTRKFTVFSKSRS